MEDEQQNGSVCDSDGRGVVQLCESLGVVEGALGGDEDRLVIVGSSENNTLGIAAGLCLCAPLISATFLSHAKTRTLA